MKLRFGGHHGFTLIELMIVVAIIALLASIAYPGYQKQVRDSRRADAAAVLVHARQLMERHYSKNYSYDNTPADVIPAKSPIDGNAEYYLIVLGSQSATTFTLVATPQGDQARDNCGELTINQSGQKTANGSAQNVDRCWR